MTSNMITGIFTHHVYDVYLNNDNFEYYKRSSDDREKEKEQFTLKRRFVPAHIPKRSLMTMLGRKEHQ